MKSWKIITAITLAVIAVALIATIAYASAFNPYRTMTPTTSFAGGMMGGWNTYTSPTQPNTQPYPNHYGGWGCMGFGRSYAAPSYTTNTTAALTVDQAAQIAQRYVTAIGNPDLKVAEIEEYTNNFYVQVHEKSTGTGAFEQ